MTGIAGSVSLSLLDVLVNRQRVHGTTYRLGAKAPTLKSGCTDFGEIDCSGESRWLVARASNGAIILPDGSVTQQEWCAERLSPVDYHDAAQCEASKLFICFISPASSQRTGRGPIGHVFLMAGGLTYESHYPNGVSRRPWDTPVLRECCDHCYRLPAGA